MVRPFGLDRDGAHRRDRDLARARRDLGCPQPGRPRTSRHRSRRRPFALARAADRARLRARLDARRCAVRGADGREVLAAMTVRAGDRRRSDRGRRRLAPRRRAVVLPRAARPRRRRAGRRSGARARDRGARARALRARRGGAGARWPPTRVADPPDGPPGAGLVAVGGFAFAPDGGARAALGGLRRRRRCIVPEVALARRGGDVRLTLAALAAPDDIAEDLLARLERRVWRAARRRPLPLLDPAPAGRFRVVERDAARALRGGRRARRRADPRRRRSRRSCSRARSQVHAPADHDPARGPRRAARGRSRPASSSAPGAATPPSWPPARSCSSAARASAPARSALAGSTRAQRRPGGRRPPRRAAAARRQGPRGAGDRRPAHRARRCAPHAVWVDRAPRAGRRADGEHPAPGHADPRAARRSRSARSSWPGCCTRRRPSAASRSAAAAPLIPALEGLDRGWYAGPVGWTDADRGRRVLRRAALRAAARRRSPAATPGVGVVRDSDPAAELAETEVKLAGAAARCSRGSPAPHGDDLAHGRAAPRRAAVERTDLEVEAARLALLDRRHQRVEAPALAVDLDDVAGGDALGRQP